MSINVLDVKVWIAYVRKIVVMKCIVLKFIYVGSRGVDGRYVWRRNGIYRIVISRSARRRRRLVLFID